MKGKALNRRAARRDVVEAGIVEALLAYGFTVQRISARDVPDLLLGKGGRTVVAEVKSGRAALRPGQGHWWQTWRGNGVIVLRSVDDVDGLARAWPV